MWLGWAPDSYPGVRLEARTGEMIEGGTQGRVWGKQVGVKQELQLETRDGQVPGLWAALGILRLR